VAAVINGYELPVAELLESRLLEALDELQLAILFASLAHEERKHELHRRMPQALFGELRRDLERVVARLVERERDLGIPPSVRPLDFRLGAAVAAWCRGADFEALREHTTAPPGDLVRVMRLAVQLLRQLRGALPRSSPLILRLDRARDLLNRDEVDAARQLSLG
jgi:superfamily II RNA helicase